MLYELNGADRQRVQALVGPLDDNLSLLSCLAGKTPGRVFVDHPLEPAAVLVVLNHHLYLAGSPPGADFSQELNRLIHGTLVPQARAARGDAYLVHISAPEWDPAVQAVLAGLYPLERPRQYFEADALLQDWRPLLPDGFVLQPVDASLVSQSHLKHMDYLREELCSERSSIEDFMEKSFGFAILHGDELVSWSLSEYNLDERCEVGIATIDEYQQRGFGTITALALVEHALAIGCRRIGWHCWKRNIPSAALARRAGFRHVLDYPVYLCIFDRIVQYALHGQVRRDAGDPAAAWEWFEKALAAGQAPGWVHYEAARCLSLLHEPDQAIGQLRQALALGFSRESGALAHPDFACLHDHPAWQALVS